MSYFLVFLVGFLALPALLILAILALGFRSAWKTIRREKHAPVDKMEFFDSEMKKIRPDAPFRRWGNN